MLSKLGRPPTSKITLIKQLTCGRFSTSPCIWKDKKENKQDDICEPKVPDCKKESKILMSPKCKVALITGASSGIGFAVATELLCAGAKNVAITGLDACQGKEAQNMLNNTFGSTKSLFIKSNVGCVVQLEEAFKKTVSCFGKIDIYVNCAGILDGTQWEREFVTNVIGTVRGNLLAFKYIGKEGNGKGGCVVNLAGIPGAFGPFPAAPTIASCWHAIIGFSRSMGHEKNANPAGIRIVTLCPGFTKTDFIKKIKSKGMTEAMGKELEEVCKKAKKQKPDVCGRAILHLIKTAKTGTVWWIEGSKLYSLKFPKKECYSTLEAQYM